MENCQNGLRGGEGGWGVNGGGWGVTGGKGAGGGGGEMEKVEKCGLKEPSTLCLDNNVAPLWRSLADIEESQRDRKQVIL